MPTRRRPPRKRPSFFEAQDKFFKLRQTYMIEGAGPSRARLAAIQQMHRDLDDVTTPEPDEELADSELSDTERQAAIARERARREGLI